MKCLMHNTDTVEMLDRFLSLLDESLGCTKVSNTVDTYITPKDTLTVVDTKRRYKSSW